MTRVGIQEPRFLVAPKVFKHNHADDCAWLATSYGLTPDPWQKLVLDAWLRESASGLWSAGRWAIAVPRQNGKNGILEMVELYLMIALGMRILHTAHEVKTARKSYKRLLGFFDNPREYPELAGLVFEHRATNGQEAIMLRDPDNPGRIRGGIEFVARSRGSARGYTSDVLVCDECQELTDEQIEALGPTISAAPSGNPTRIYMGTPPGPGSPGTVFARARDKALKGKDKRVAWVEWSVSEVGNVRDRSRWAEANPALGIRLSESTIEDELSDYTAEGFARERLGWWAEGGAKVSRLISPEEWQECRVSEPPESGTRSAAVAFGLEGRGIALAGAVKKGNSVHAELIDYAPGDEGDLSALADWLAARKGVWAEIALCGGTQPRLLRQELLDRKVPDRMIHVLTTPEYLTACDAFHQAVMERRVTVPDAEVESPLEKAVTVCDRKFRGSGWGWIATDGQTDETPIEAVSVAMWVAKTTKRRPGRPVKVVTM